VRSRYVIFTATLATSLALAATATATATAATVSRWGSYLAGLPEPGPVETQMSPTSVDLEGVTMIDASNSSSYALKSDGTVWAWGDGTVDQLGDGNAASSSSPVQVAFPKGVVITTIGESKNQGYAIDSNGEAWTWGQGSSDCMPGRLHDKPVKIAGITEAVAVQGGGNHVAWLERNGEVLGCGTNNDGQLGLGEGVRSTRFATVIPGLKSIVQISAGDQTLEARDSSGRVFMCGENVRGQVGVGSSARAVWAPTEVPLPEPAINISAGGDLVPNGTSFAITQGGVYGWGNDRASEVGDGRQTTKRLPVNTGLHFTSVASGGAFVLGLDDEGNVYSWGLNTGGALGTGAAGRRSAAPVLVDTGVSAISATARNALDLHP
jgi:Regulator of chromosome condensation (RCC1) repeat